MSDENPAAFLWNKIPWHQRDPPAHWLELTQAKWFTRGWTLQEFLAPHDAHFFSEDWRLLGDRGSLATLIAQACSITHEVITGRQSLARGYLAPFDFQHGSYESRYDTLHALRLRVTAFFERFSVAQRISWAAGRRLTRIEDEAYSLLGVFDVKMPILYGEGQRAFLRLQQAIMKSRIDHTIFVWENTRTASLYDPMENALLAPSANGFRGQESIIQGQFDLRCVYEVTNIGVRVRMPCQDITGHSSRRRLILAVLHC